MGDTPDNKSSRPETIDLGQAEAIYHQICQRLLVSANIDDLIEPLDYPSFHMVDTVASLKALHAKNSNSADKLQNIADTIREEHSRLSKERRAKRKAHITGKLNIEEVREASRKYVKKTTPVPLVSDQKIIDNALRNRGQFEEKDIEGLDHVALQNLEIALNLRALSCKLPQQKRNLQRLAKEAAERAQKLNEEAGAQAKADYLSRSREIPIGKTTAMEMTALNPKTGKPYTDDDFDIDEEDLAPVTVELPPTIPGLNAPVFNPENQYSDELDLNSEELEAPEAVIADEENQKSRGGLFGWFRRFTGKE